MMYDVALSRCRDVKKCGRGSWRAIAWLITKIYSQVYEDCPVKNILTKENTFGTKQVNIIV